MEELAKRKDTIIINVNKGDDILITHVKKIHQQSQLPTIC